MCSTWYLVSLSLKSERFLNKSTIASVGIPTFTKKDVKVNLPMCDK